MTEGERAEKIAHGQRVRWGWDVAVVAAVLMALGALVGVWNVDRARADAAEQTLVSVAEQVQAECDTNGELRVDGRDLCERVDDVVEDPGAAATPVDGRDGVDGTDGADGTDGTDGVDGEDGVDGTDGTDGVDGVDGTDGVAGANGTNGIDGAAGRGIQSMQCATGGWIITYTDGIAASDSGPCRGPAGENGTDGEDSTVPGPPGVGIKTIECPDTDTDDWIVTLTDDSTQTVAGPCRVEPIIEPPTQE